MPSRTPRSAAYGAIAAIPSATISRAAPMSRSGAAPHTSTSTSAPSVAASSIARRLSSMRALRSAAVGAGNIPPRQTLETRSPASRTQPRGALEPRLGELVPPDRDAGHAVPRARLDHLGQRRALGRRLVEAEQRCVLQRRRVVGRRRWRERTCDRARLRGPSLDPRHARTRRARAMPPAPDRRAARHASARRINSPRCTAVRALSAPPSMRKCVLMAVEVREEDDPRLVRVRRLA